MIETGLTEREKESLLKFFLTNGELLINSNGNYEWKFYNNYIFEDFEKELAHLISKAHISLLMGAMQELGVFKE